MSVALLNLSSQFRVFHALKQIPILGQLHAVDVIRRAFDDHSFGIILCNMSHLIRKPAFVDAKTKGQIAT